MQWYEWFILISLSLVILLLMRQLIKALQRFYILIQGPFYAPTSQERIEQLIKLTTSIFSKNPHLTVLDLGSGDGRVLVELAKRYPVTAVGYEIDPALVAASRRLIAKSRLKGTVSIHQTSFWDADVGQADLVFCYCIQRCMEKLAQKLRSELKSKAQVVSVFFRFPHWQPTRSQGEIHLYSKPRVSSPHLP